MNDFDVIKNLFDQDQVETPDSLSAENMLRMIEQVQPEEKPVETIHAPQRTWPTRWKYIAVLAACFVAVLVAVPTIRSATQIGDPGKARGVTSGSSESAQVAKGLQTFDSEDEISKLIADARDSQEGIILDGEVPLAGVAEDATKAEGYSETYKQVDDVDEADIIKTDGKYIYCVTGYREIDIYRAKDGEAKKIATISKFDEDTDIDNMYLDGDRLVTIGTFYGNSGHTTLATAFDVSDPAKPKELGHFEQSGTLVSSRVVHGTVYLVTNDYARSGHILPFVTQENGFKKMDIKDVCAFKNTDTLSYVVVSSVDFKTGKEIDSQSKAILGASGDIYCNTENLYVACLDYSGSTAVTRLAKTKLKDGKINFDTAGKVRGSIIGQFAMDEKDGYFRIATTANKNGRDVNNLYVLDSNLKQIGSVAGFARDEHIEAVRFMGERAYVITYEQIDPLFILDLSDPKDPKIDGEVEITGFSTQLVPVSDTRLVGIGYATEDNGYGGEMSNGMKIALFDISDPSAPKVLDAKEYPDYDSEAQYDHHAILQNTKAGYLAIPYAVSDEQWIEDDVIIEDAETGDAEESRSEAAETADGTAVEKVRGGVLVFKAGDTIEELKNFEVANDSVRRCIYIGDDIYVLDASDEITSFKL